MHAFKGYLNSSGLIVPTVTMQAQFKTSYNAFLNMLTVTYYPKVGPPKRAKLYLVIMHKGEQCIQLPRTLTKSLLEKKIISEFAIEYPPVVHMTKIPHIQIELFENQKIVVRKLMEVFSPERIAAGTASAILNLRPGLGKTFVAAGIIDVLKIAERPVRTLYIVPKRPLAVQAVKDLRACLYSDGADVNNQILIGQYASKVSPTKAKKDPSSLVSNQDITVIVVNSALGKDAAFFAGYSFVIFDEVHTYCSDVRKEIFSRAGTWVCLGMSGTTDDRSDGFDKISHRHLAFDGVIHAEKLPGFTYEGVDFKSNVTVIRYDGPPEYTKLLQHEATGMVFTPYMNKQFLSDPHRMKLAINELKKLYEWKGYDEVNDPHHTAPKQHCIYVFCEELEPLKKVYEELKKAIVPANLVDINDPNVINEPVFAPELLDVGHFVGGIKNARIIEMTANARVFLTTYGYSGTGISIDKMTAILFLTPRRANMKQILPRILRRSGDQTITRQIIDIVDNKTRIKYQYGDRAIAYDHYNMNVVVKKVKWNEI
jgi:hypothetical protein